MVSALVTDVGGEAGVPNPVRSVRVSAHSAGAIARLLPVSEFVFTQLGPGQFAINATTIAADDVVLTRTHVLPLATGTVVPDPSLVAFLLPIRCQGPYRYNGIELVPSSLCIAGGLNGYHTRGADRESITIALLRSRLIATIAALRGVAADEIRLDDRVLNLPRPTAARLRARLAAIIAHHSGPRAGSDVEQSRHDVRNEVCQLLIDAYLDSQATPDKDVTRLAQRRGIVRRAEDRFLAAEGRPISMADLCAAAGVGRTALQRAFHDIYGESPLSYIHKRRLTQAREAIMLAPTSRAAIKRAALGAGLTSLGRFSVEYRLLFGERPSATLAEIDW